MLRLDQNAVQFFQTNGYTLFREPVFSEAKFAQLKTIFETLSAKAQAVGKRIDELDVPHFEDPRLFDYLLADEVLDLVEPLIGPDIGLWSSHFIAKEPFTGRATPWHEDSAYWEGRFDRMDQIVTVWLAIDPADEENGCMRVIPGTHHHGFSDYETVESLSNTFERAIRPDQIDESKAVYFALQPNQCSLHDARLIHGAKANTSPRRRCGYTMRYFSQSMRLNLEHPSNGTHRIWHARGRNVAENPVEAVPTA
ncbi:MAG: phytanoyl-CoA dioxygenase family protein [bacterium]|nr:phytanoyl-CoA dioxygenase family protein [bacterium]